MIPITIPSTGNVPPRRLSMYPLRRAMAAAGWAVVSACLVMGCASRRPDTPIDVIIAESTEPLLAPPAAEFIDITPQQVRSSLRRITVRHSTWMLFIRSDPKPLLSEGQLDFLQKTLIRELPNPAPGRRIRFVFRDQYRGELVDMEVYPEGEYLVYFFRALIRPSGRVGPGPTSPNRGILEPLSGQIVQPGVFPVLKDLALRKPADEETPF